MVVFHVDLFGLPVTSGAVGVLEGRLFAPGDALVRPHHPLESSVVAGGAVAMIQTDRMLSILHLLKFEGFRCLLRLKRSWFDLRLCRSQPRPGDP